ncbi:MAG: TonB-dependent receptor [Pseudomonadota bacterium]
MGTTFKTKLLASVWAAGLATALPQSAIAQEAGNASDDADKRLGTVTVTAQFREQSLQDVPNAVTAFTAETIKDAGMRSTEDFIALTPNVTFDDSFTYLNSFVVIRGVTQINNADSPVAIIVDGVPQNNQKQFKMPLFDVEQIEVLKGPQGSLYGRNAIGGAINIVTAQPTNEIEGFASAEAANAGAYRVQGGISGPIIEDTLLYRLSASHYQTDGLIENAFLGQEVDFVDQDLSVRGKLAFTPNDRFSLDLRAAYNDVDAGSSYDTIVNSGNNPDFRSDNDANDIFDPTSNFAGFTEAETTEFTAKAEWALGDTIATYILGYTDLKEIYRADLDFSNPTQGTFGAFGELGQGQNLGVELTSHELRFVSPDDRAFRWLGGAYYLDTKRDLRTRAFLDLDGQASQFVDGVVIIDRNEANENTAWALFGQVEFDLNDRATLQIGARYHEDERNQTIPGTAGSDRSETFDSFQPKVTLSYDFTEQVIGYATYSSGFRSGGFNAPGVVLEEFDDETLSNFEVGFKSEFADGRGVLNAAAFMTQSDDFQFFFVDVSTISQIISNLDEVDIAGFDMDVQFQATDELTLYGGLGFTDSEIKSIGSADLEAFLTSSGVDISQVIGASSPKTTELTLNVGGQFVKPLENGFNLVLRADYEYQGDKYWQIDNVDVRDPINLLSLRAAIERDNWTLAIWGRNLFDEEYYADFNPSEYAGAPFDLGFQARPQTYGVELRYDF